MDALSTAAISRENANSMKTIAVVANKIEYAHYMRDNLHPYLRTYAEITCYSMKELQDVDFIPGDLVVVSAFTIFQALKHKIRFFSEIVVATITVNPDRLLPLAAYPLGTKALLCNIDYRTCMQVIAELYMTGYRNLELTPYHGEGEYDPEIRLAITPDEPQMVPAGMPEVVDIGQRVVDLNCIYDIAVRLGVGEEFAASEPMRRRAHAGAAHSSIEKVLGERYSLAGQVNVLLTLIPQGILVTNISGTICLSNEKAGKILEKRSEVLVGFVLGDILPELGETAAQAGKELPRDLIVDIGGQNIVVSMRRIDIGGEAVGSVVILDNFEEREAIQHGIRSRLSQVEHFARYRFEDIKGSGPTIREAIVTARRLAKSDSSILIMGESGTGKELFAQGIHNESPRHGYNFVAVNCAAIPENLLESEMFGYEEGSFTGARKGGRAGYFELSHRGTIFLDEIAEMPLLLQSKLLRVIEERKIIKIGSNKVVDVDVRIIAATNKDLYDMVERGEFREDLYYRLNVLPLRLPALRDRPEDILPLVEHFRKVMGFTFSLSPESSQIVSRYAWRGNIRELRNTVEYLGSMDKTVVEAADLPFRKARPAAAGGPARPMPRGGDDKESPLVRSFLLKEGRRLDVHLFILRGLQSAQALGQRLGRRALAELAAENGSPYTEAEIRGSLKLLDNYGFAIVGKGRGGSRITAEGVRLLENYELG